MAVAAKGGAGAVLALAACFSPTVPEGLPCGPPPELACPQGQTCDPTGHCLGAVEPDGPVAAADGPPGPRIDALPGAPDAGYQWTFTRIEELSSGSSDQDPSMTEDGLQIVFASSRAGGLGGYDLYTSFRASTSEPWGPPILISALSSPGDDQSPEMGRQGLSIYFTSNRAGSSNFDVYASFRTTRSMPFPTPMVVAGLSTSDGEYNIAHHNNTIAIISRDTPAGNRDLYLSERASTNDPWPNGTPITELNDDVLHDSSPFLSDDHLVLYFHRIEPVASSYRMFRTSRPDLASPFAPAVQLFVDEDQDPWASTDDRMILFMRDDDIYMATRP